MALQEYHEALLRGYDFLENHDQLLHSLKLSRINVDNQSYSEDSQGIGNGPIESGQGSGDVSNTELT